MALGAQASAILRSVLRRAATETVAGLVVGLGLAWFLATWVEKLLFNGAPHVLRLFAAVSAVLLAAALVAAILPARRGARVDPLVALRLE
jgi:ABC-type antimicrobial peptide transport system permease subunit